LFCWYLDVVDDDDSEVTCLCIHCSLLYSWCCYSTDAVDTILVTIVVDDEWCSHMWCVSDFWLCILPNFFPFISIWPVFKSLPNYSTDRARVREERPTDVTLLIFIDVHFWAVLFISCRLCSILILIFYLTAYCIAIMKWRLKSLRWKAGEEPCYSYSADDSICRDVTLVADMMSVCLCLRTQAWNIILSDVYSVIICVCDWLACIQYILFLRNPLTCSSW